MVHTDIARRRGFFARFAARPAELSAARTLRERRTMDDSATTIATGNGRLEPRRTREGARKTRTSSFLAGMLAVTVFPWAQGCGTSTTAPTSSSGDAGPGAHGGCTAGTTFACACSGGGVGTQVCNSAGTAYGICACPASSDAGSPGGFGSADAGSSDDAGSPSGSGDGGSGDGGHDDGGTSPCGGEPVPAQATAAGFTTCAYDYDFSQSKYAAESSWLDWNNSNPDLPWHNGWPGGLSHFPDGNIAQTTDPTNGQKVLDLRWDQSFDGQQSGNNSFLSIQTIMNGGGSTSDHGITFPNFYAETTYRIDNDGASGDTTSGPDGVWTWQLGGGQEFDFAELYGTAGGFGDNGTGGGGYTWVTYREGIPGNQNIPKNWSPVVYHKYGTLTTTNGTNARSTCTWIDGAFQSCVATDNVSDNPNWLVIWVGGSGASATQLPTTNLLLQYVRIWSCPSWNSDECDGATQVQQTQSGTTLTYWKP